MGDYNLDKHTVQSALARLIEARVLSCGEPTCRTSHGASGIDLFVVSMSLDEFLSNVQLWDQLEVVTHSAVRLDLKHAHNA